MQVTIEVPNSLPQGRLQQRIKEIEESLRKEIRFIETTENRAKEALERGFRHPFGKNLDFLSADKHYFSGFWGNLQEFQKLAFQGQNRVFGLFWATVDDWPEWEKRRRFTQLSILPNITN
ncbi:MAG: hypothetical protein QME81_16400 [bacterium]|nr:hypothetical protein [bacterium]